MRIELYPAINHARLDLFRIRHEAGLVSALGTELFGGAHDKAALLTDSTSGMGLAIARVLASHERGDSGDLPRLVADPLVVMQLHGRAWKSGQHVGAGKRELLAAEQRMHQFSTPQQIGALAPLSMEGG